MESIPTERPESVLRGLTIERTMIVSTFVVVFMLGAQLRVDTDVWWHLRAGAYIFEHGFIRHDSFSYTMAGRAWIDHSWGSEILFDALWRLGGYGALELLTGLLALVGAALVYRMCSGGTYLRCVAAGLASLVASVFWTPRPQMFSFALAAVTLYILHERRNRGVDALWTLPLVMLVWANLHGGFVVGLAIVGATLLGELLERVAPLDERTPLDLAGLRRLTWVFAACLVAVCLNPYGPAVLRVPLDLAGGSFSGLIEEWAPPDLHSLGFWPFAALLAALVFAVGVSPVRLGWSDGLLCVGATLLAMTAARNLSIFAVVVTPVMTYHLHAALAERGRTLVPIRRASIPIALANVAILAVVVGVTVGRVSPAFVTGRLDAREQESLPVVATSFLRTNGVRGQLFNAYDWGGYLIHALPGVPVFVDGRSDLYGRDFLEGTYMQLEGGGPGWEEMLDRYEISTVLVRRTSGLAVVLARSGNWDAVHFDPLAVVFERAQG